MPRLRTICLRCLVAVCSLLPAPNSVLGADLNSRLIGEIDPFAGDNRYADVWGEGNYAYLGSYNGTGVMIVDISNPRSPVLVGHYNPPSGGRFQDVVVIGGIGYFSSENAGGVHIVDVRDPANPVLLSNITAAQNGYAFVHELFVSGGVLYEADSRTPRIKAFDVRDPAAPVFIRDIVTTDTRFIHAITVVNGRLYTSGWSGKTDIYDVSNILNEAPVLLGSVNSGNNSHSSWVSSDGKLLASARETVDGDVRLFDISDPANPVMLAAMTAASLGFEGFSAHNPYIFGNLLIVAWYQGGTVVIDISNPSSPTLIGSFDSYPGAVNGFDGNWGVFPFLGLDRVLLSDMDRGLLIVDFSGAVTEPRTVSAASYAASAITEKAIVSAFGSNLTDATEQALSLPLGTVLGNTTVRVQDASGTERLAPLFYVSPRQINFQIPPGASPGPAKIIVNGNAGIRVGVAMISAAAPSLFTNDQSGSGAAAALDAFTFTPAPFAPARGDGEPNVIAFFGTGLGGDATDSSINAHADSQATIDGRPAIVEFAGAAPGFPGLNQWNVRLPAGITPGVHDVTVGRQGRTSNTVTVVIGQ